jgi:acetolactate synthase-1/2/3 large subunit
VRSIPLVVIIGQVPTHLIGNDAFQECDTVGITRPRTKHNYLVKSVASFARAARGSTSPRAGGRPGRGRHPEGHPPAKGMYARPKDFQHKGYHPKVKGTSTASRPRSS